MTPVFNVKDNRRTSSSFKMVIVYGNVTILNAQLRTDLHVITRKNQISDSAKSHVSIENIV